MVTLITTVLSSAAKVGDRVFVGIYLNCPYVSTPGVDVVLDVSSELKVNDVILTHLLGGDTANKTVGNRVLFLEVTPPDGANFTGGGLLAILDCTAVNAGKATITFDFTVGLTTDCNVDSGTIPGADMLAAVSNRTITIS